MNRADEGTDNKHIHVKGGECDQGAGVRWVGRIGRHGTEELYRRWSLNWNPKEYRELMEKLRVFGTKETLSANAPTVGKSFLVHSWEERMAG